MHVNRSIDARRESTYRANLEEVQMAPSERLRVLAETTAAAALGAAGAAAPVALLSICCQGGWSRAAELPLYVASLGAAFGIFERDRRAALAPRERAGRTAGALTGAFAAFVLAIAAMGRHEYLWVRSVVLFAAAGPAMAALVAVYAAPLLRSWSFQLGAVMAGIPAFLLLARDAFALGMTLGGSATAGFTRWLWFFGWEWWSHSTDQKMLLFVVVVPMVGIVAALLLTSGRPRAAALWSEIALAVGLLGWSFRLTAVVFLVGVLAYSASRTRVSIGAWRWKLRIAFVALCLAPVDISVRSGVGPSHFAPAIMGALSADGIRAAERGEVYVVGGCTSVYNEPSWVWIW